ncbi:MAG: ADP-ribosylation factor-like protein, partial [Candidatus Hodarchaeales archaeon]
MNKEISPTENRRIFLIGLSEAGKTSIFKRFFLKTPIDEIKQLTPTIFFTINAPTVSYLGEEITLLDLGGQVQFRKKYVEDTSIFRGIRTVIFVIDVTAPEKLDEIIDYFQSIFTAIKSVTNNQPVLGVFLHKYDPDIKEQLRENITQIVSKMYPLVSENNGAFHLTSIYDHSLTDAMINILFLSLPDKIIQKSLGFTDLETFFDEIIEDAGDANVSSEDLSSFSINYGVATGNKFRDSWILDYKKEEKKVPATNIKNTGIKIIKKGRKLIIDLHFKKDSEKLDL